MAPRVKCGFRMQIPSADVASDHRHPSGWQWRLHDEVIADAVESNGGWLFKHTGDGIVAAFRLDIGSRTNREVHGSARATIDAQRRLELPVRHGYLLGRPRAPR